MKVRNLLTVLTVATVLTACGSAGNRSAGTDMGGGGSTNSGSSPGSNLPPGQEVDFLIGGTIGAHGYQTFQAPQVYTDSNLSIKITPLPASNMIFNPSQSYTAKYACVKFIIKVNGIPRETDYISVGGVSSQFSENTNCAGKPSSQTLTFPGIVTGGGTPVIVEMSAPQYDNCRQKGQEGLTQAGCTMSTVWSSGPTTAVNGTAIPARSHLIRGTMCLAGDGQHCF